MVSDGFERAEIFVEQEQSISAFGQLGGDLEKSQ